jgi:aldose 1-epimerase
MVLLKFESFELGLAPELGGTVTHFRHRGRDLLRPADGDNPTGAAAFPMIPFSGRIADGRFNWQGRHIQLDANFPPETHAIHGHGWTRGWQTDATGADNAVLSYVHAPDAWPWAYRAVQAFRLGASGLELTLSVTNLSGESMPAGIGWHPYFPSRGAQIEADTSMIWETGEDKIPKYRRAPAGTEQLRKPQGVESLGLDTPFETTGGPVSLRWPEEGISLRMLTDDALLFLVVYTPAGEKYFCAEPVSHIPNMVNMTAPARDTGLVSLAPGKILSGRIRLELVPPEATGPRRT